MLPGYAAAARNAPAGPPSAPVPSGRNDERFHLICGSAKSLIAPNGSLVTPIEERVSPSAWMLAQHYGGRVVPWFFSYDSPGGRRWRATSRCSCCWVV